jgi:hypothetical protein
LLLAGIFSLSLFLSSCYYSTFTSPTGQVIDRNVPGIVGHWRQRNRVIADDRIYDNTEHVPHYAEEHHHQPDYVDRSYPAQPTHRQPAFPEDHYHHEDHYDEYYAPYQKAEDFRAISR